MRKSEAKYMMLILLSGYVITEDLTKSYLEMNYSS